MDGSGDPESKDRRMIHLLGHGIDLVQLSSTAAPAAPAATAPAGFDLSNQSINH